MQSGFLPLTLPLAPSLHVEVRANLSRLSRRGECPPLPPSPPPPTNPMRCGGVIAQFQSRVSADRRVRVGRPDQGNGLCLSRPVDLTDWLPCSAAAAQALRDGDRATASSLTAALTARRFSGDEAAAAYSAVVKHQSTVGTNFQFRTE